ncbi:MAG: hypothetical protein ABFQ89_03355 [Chloroflexota bacterium]
MSHTLLVHLTYGEPFLAETERHPDVDDQLLICHNPRRRDGKDVDLFLPEVTTVYIPWSKINFIELVPTEEDDDIFSFVRE